MRTASEELSRRELEVVAFVTEGLTNRQIAERLSISARTVQSHIRRTMAKTGARSRTQLAVRVVCRGLVACPECPEDDTHAEDQRFGGLRRPGAIGSNAASDANALAPDAGPADCQ
jgi:DNA-binding CsgD family transcriptional regulator